MFFLYLIDSNGVLSIHAPASVGLPSRARRSKSADVVIAAAANNDIRIRRGALARSERFELPTLGIEIRCSIQLSYERLRGSIIRLVMTGPAAPARPGMKRWDAPR